MGLKSEKERETWLNEQDDIEYLAKLEEEHFYSLPIEEREKYARIWQKSVFYGHKDECDHKIDFGIAQIEAISCVTPQIVDGFEIREGICHFCGKTLCLCIEKVKEVEKVE